MSNNRLRFFILAGEASGDMHGARLVQALQKLQKDAEFAGWGGERMQSAGVLISKHYRSLAFMGFAEVIKNLPAIFRNFRTAKTEILTFNPDVLILIDYPGFNLRMAKWAKKQGFKVAYYISPQIWAWKENRAHIVRQYVDRMICILPFEPAFYEKFGVIAPYVGHPLIEEIRANESINANLDKGVKSIALMPGSRTQEISKMLPVMLKIADSFPDYQFKIVKAPSQQLDVYEDILARMKKDEVCTLSNVSVHTEGMGSICAQASAALVTSGTATLETALYGVPQVVCYKGSALSYQIARRLIKVRFISLVNLILDSGFLTELIQDDLEPEKLKAALTQILHPDSSDYFEEGYATLRSILHQEEFPSLAAARQVLALV
jgi:lipid-A-disaccharide synthase